MPMCCTAVLVAIAIASSYPKIDAAAGNIRLPLPAILYLQLSGKLATA